MADAKPAHARRAGIAAALTTLAVVAFACVFVGSIMALDRIAPARGGASAVEIDSTLDQPLPSEPFYVLLIGSDTRKGTALYTGKASDHAQVDQHSDIMTLVRIDPSTYHISLLSIPRDTVAPGETSKINDALMNNDPNDVVDAVGQLTGVYADYYMMVNFVSFPDLVDALGGIDVDVPKTIKVSNPETGGSITVKEGENRHLNGAQTLALARARKEYGDNQDVVRQANVRAIEQAIIEQSLDLDDLVPAERLLSVVEEDIRTNMSLSMLGLLVVDFSQHSGEVTFVSGTGPYEGGGERKSDGQWVIEADEDAWKEVMAVFTAGGDPSTVVKPLDAG